MRRCALVILLAVFLPTSSAHARCVAARLVAEVTDAEATHRTTQMLPCPGPAAAAASWEDLARRIVWPARDPVGGDLLGTFLLTDAKLPAVQVALTGQRVNDMAVSAAPCRAQAFALSGESSGEAPGDGPAGANAATKKAREVTVAGEGRALLCEGEVTPRAAAWHLLRRVKPTIWEAAKPDQVIEDAIDVAWAVVP